MGIPLNPGRVMRFETVNTQAIGAQINNLSMRRFLRGISAHFCSAFRLMSRLFIWWVRAPMEI